jgi:hypothetical protein
VIDEVKLVYIIMLSKVDGPTTIINALSFADVLDEVIPEWTQMDQEDSEVAQDIVNFLSQNGQFIS